MTGGARALRLALAGPALTLALGAACSFDDLRVARFEPQADGRGAQETWQGLGGSDFGPASTLVTWGSASGGGVSASAGRSIAPNLTRDLGGRPMLVWQEQRANQSEIYARVHDGGAWRELGAGAASGGGVSNTPGYSTAPVIAVDGAGRPVLAWQEFAATEEIYVRVYDAGAWQELGAGSASGSGLSGSTGWSRLPSIAIDGAGKPMVAWQCDSYDFRTYVLHVQVFDGAAWQELGAGELAGTASSMGDMEFPSLAVDAASRPMIAWGDHGTGTWQIYVRVYQGGHWEELGTGSASGGGISSSAADALLPTLMLDEAGQPVVSWLDTSGSETQVFARVFSAGAWQELGAGSASDGGVSHSASGAMWPRLGLDGADQPMVAWGDGGFSNSEIFARAFSAGAWQEVGVGSASGGGVSRTSGSSGYPCVGLDGARRPLIAWQDDSSGNSEIYVRVLDHGAWVELDGGRRWSGGISNGADASRNPTLIFDGQGWPAVAWSENIAGVGAIYGRTYDGEDWVELGQGSTTGGGISQSQGSAAAPALTVDDAGRPVLVWHDTSSGVGQIYALRYGDGAWAELGAGAATGGGISRSTGGAFAPAVGRDGAGRVVVVWQDRSSGDMEIYARVLDGEIWTELGLGSDSGAGISSSAGTADAASLGLDEQGRPVVAWRDYHDFSYALYVRVLEGGLWRELGAGSASVGLANGTGAVLALSLAQDAAGRPVLAWSETSASQSEIYARRFSAGAWEPCGAGAAEAGGLSRSPGDSVSPRLASDAAGRLVVAWQDDSAGNTEIYVRRFDGDAWRELGEGSATGGGISNSAAQSAAPAAAIDGDRVCVAWTEGAQRTTEIVLRCAPLL